MEFVDTSGTRYQLAEAVEAPAPAKKAPGWPWVVGGLALTGGLVWMASIRSRKANPVSPELKELMEDARDPKTSFHYLKWLQKHSEEEVRRALLDNPNILPMMNKGCLNTDLLVELAEEFPEEVAVHPLFILHVLVEPADEMVGVVREVVGRTADAGLIETLWRTWGPLDWSVRQAVALNMNTPPDVLRLLGNEVTEPHWWVREAVAKNPNTPLDVLRLLGNPNTESQLFIREDANEALAKRGTEMIIKEAPKKSLAKNGLA